MRTLGIRQSPEREKYAVVKATDEEARAACGSQGRQVYSLLLLYHRGHEKTTAGVGRPVEFLGRQCTAAASVRATAAK
ncbi:MAG: hypothetical protein LAO04_17230 [Acidobacteriia bacterium]|nr:hypothetical protein [Terriglobia bacterium]